MEQLEAYFDHFLGIPDGIKKLRELILTLAMQGKLVEQDPNDQPASELLKEIEAEKKLLMAEGKIKKPKPLPEIKPEEVPYELPAGWEWVRLGNVGTTNIGLTYKPTQVSNHGTPVLRSNNIQNGQIVFRNLVRVNAEIRQNTYAHPGDILICARNGSRRLVGKAAIIPISEEVMAFGAFMAIYRSRINPFVLRFIHSPIFRRVIDEVNTTTINQITQANLNKALFPLPPLNEQHRIVQKIDSLMALCDQLEARRKERDAKRLSMHSSAVHHLQHSSDENEFAASWSFITDRFDSLYSVKENVEELKKAILSLAMQGKLVEQDPNDQPASELLKEIEAEKKRLVAAGKIKKPKPLPEIKPEEVPYELPKGWEWVRLGEYGYWKSGSTPSRGNSKFYNGNIPWVKSGEVKQGRISTAEETISDLALTKCSLDLNPVGSVLIAMYGANIGDVGILEIEATTNQAVCACQTYAEVDNAFLLRLLSSLKASFIVQGAGAAQPNISKVKIRNTIVPLPPLNEQHRIVQKIDALMALCDSLLTRIDGKNEKSEQLVNAVLARV